MLTGLFQVQAPVHMARAFTQPHCLPEAAEPLTAIQEAQAIAVKFPSYVQVQTSVPLSMLFRLPGMPFPILLPPDPLCPVSWFLHITLCIVTQPPS